MSGRMEREKKIYMNQSGSLRARTRPPMPVRPPPKKVIRNFLARRGCTGSNVSVVKDDGC